MKMGSMRNIRGKQFLMGKKTEDPKNFFVREL